MLSGYCLLAALLAHVPRVGSYGSPADQAVVLFNSVQAGAGSVIGADAVILLIGGRTGHIVDEVPVCVHPATLLMMRISTARVF